jgi:hypothetical protein
MEDLTVLLQLLPLVVLVDILILGLHQVERLLQQLDCSGTYTVTVTIMLHVQLLVTL